MKSSLRVASIIATGLIVIAIAILYVQLQKARTPITTPPEQTNSRTQEKTPAQPTPDRRVLATSPDNLFVLTGTVGCSGTYSIAKEGYPFTDEGGNTIGAAYSLVHPTGTEDSDLGTVILQTTQQYDAYPVDKHNAMYQPSYRTNGSVALAVFSTEKSMVPEECSLKIEPHTSTP